MDLQQCNEIIETVNGFVDLINNCIGILRADKVINGNEITLRIINPIPEKNKVADFLYEKIHFKVYHNSNNRKMFHVGTFCQSFDGVMERINSSITFEGENVLLVIKELTNIVYEAVDEAKIEFAFHIEEISGREVPDMILWELDEWNEGWCNEDYPEKCVPDEQIKTYGFKKDWLYSISLG